jgi:hypothetical protein
MGTLVNTNTAAVGATNEDVATTVLGGVKVQHVLAADPATGTTILPASKTDVDAVTAAVTALSSAQPLPTGAATSALQTTGNTKLDALVAALADIIRTAPEGLGQSWAPGYNRADLGGGQISVDQGGALVSRSLVLTDEGTFRANFANSSIEVAIGSCSVSGDVVTGTFPDTLDVKWGNYFKFDADGESAWTQIASLDSQTEFTLVGPYLGAATSGAASRVNMRPMNASAITVASGAATLACGTTADQATGLLRKVDYCPIVFRARLSLSQRIVNQNILAGLREDAATPRWFARFRFNGTVATTVIAETGRNPTGAPSASETQSTTLTIPNGQSTVTAQDLRVEVLADRVAFYIGGMLVAEHVNVIPQQDDTFACVVECVNGAVAPASNTNIVVDYVTCKNHDAVETALFSDSAKIIAAPAPSKTFTYSQAGVIPINTDLLIIDCQQFAEISIDFQSVGTTGVITTAWSNSPTFPTVANAVLTDAAGAAAGTISAAAIRKTPRHARYLRLRLTTATTAGTTTIVVNGFPTASTQIPSIQAASQNGTWTVQPGNTANTTAWLVNLVASSAQGSSTTHHAISAASTNATSVKASAGMINTLSISNLNPAARYFKLYNKASAPTVGTDTPVATIYLAPNSLTVVNCGPFGRRLATGIAYALTTGIAVADTGAVAASEHAVEMSLS